jgi:uncharacterized membrane protein
MKRFLAGLLALSLTVVTGCGDKGTPGGPGVNNPNNNKPVVGTADSTFTLDVPNLSTSIKQGETKVITIGINRGKNFDQNVTLKLENLPNGLTASPSSPVINRGEKEVKFNVTASTEAAIGDFVIKVHGDPATGADAHSEFKVSVEKL